MVVISVFRFQIPWPIALLAITDLLILLFSAYLGISIRNFSVSWLNLQEGTLPTSFTQIQNQIGQMTVFAAVSLVALFMLGAYRRPTLIRFRDAVPSILLAHILAFMLLAVLFYIFKETRIWRLALLPALLLSLLLVTLSHYLFKQHIAYQRLRRRIIVLGTGSAANSIARMTAAGRTPMVDCLGFIPLDRTSPLIKENQIVHCNTSLADFSEREAVDEIVVALEERRKTLPIEDLLNCRLGGILVTNLSTFFEREEGRVELETIHPSWMIFAPGFLRGEAHAKDRQTCIRRRGESHWASSWTADYGFGRSGNSR